MRGERSGVKYSINALESMVRDVFGMEGLGVVRVWERFEMG